MPVTYNVILSLSRSDSDLIVHLAFDAKDAIGVAELDFSGKELLSNLIPLIDKGVQEEQNIDFDKVATRVVTGKNVN